MSWSRKLFKKIEIWILYLVLVFAFVSHIIFGALAIRHHDGRDKIPIIVPFSKAAHFLAMVPRNLKKILTGERNPRMSGEQRFNNKSGFNGNFCQEEMYLLLSRFDSDILEGVVELVNLNTFETLHIWNPNLDNFWENVPQLENTAWENLMRDRNDNRARLTHPYLMEDGGLIAQDDTPLYRIDKDSKLKWLNDDQVYHHSLEVDFEGNFWVPVRYFPFKVDKKFVGNKVENFQDDGLRKLTPKGEILFDKSISEIFIENGLEYLLFANGKHSWNRDPLHINDIEPVESDGKYWKKGDVFLSLRSLSMIVLYRPSSNQIVQKINGPFFNQHDVDILNNFEISIFDNHLKQSHNGRFVDGNNRVVIYNFEKDNFSFYFNEALEKEEVRTITGGRSQILPGGSLFVEEDNYGRLLFFNSDGSLRWEYINRGNNNVVSELGWSRLLYKDKDLKIVQNLLKKLYDG